MPDCLESLLITARPLFTREQEWTRPRNRELILERFDSTAHEREALEFLRDALPDRDPVFLYSNFEFIAADGSVNEIDALVVTQAGVFPVELKSRGGIVAGNRHFWDWTKDGHTITVDSPVTLANSKARKLAGLLGLRRRQFRMPSSPMLATPSSAPAIAQAIGGILGSGPTALMGFARQLQLRDGQQLADKRRQQTKCRRKRALAGGSPTACFSQPGSTTTVLYQPQNSQPIPRPFSEGSATSFQLSIDSDGGVIQRPAYHLGCMPAPGAWIGLLRFQPRPLAQRGEDSTQSSNQRNTFRCASERTILRMPAENFGQRAEWQIRGLRRI